MWYISIKKMRSVPLMVDSHHHFPKQAFIFPGKGAQWVCIIPKGRHFLRESQNYHLPWYVTWLRYQVAFMAPQWPPLHSFGCKTMLMLPQGPIEKSAIFVTLRRACKSTGDLVKMQILMQWVWNGTWNSKYGNKLRGDFHPAGPWATLSVAT